MTQLEYTAKIGYGGESVYRVRTLYTFHNGQLYIVIAGIKEDGSMICQVMNPAYRAGELTMVAIDDEVIRQRVYDEYYSKPERA